VVKKHCATGYIPTSVSLVFRGKKLCGPLVKLRASEPPFLRVEKLGKLYYILLFTGGIYAASFTEYFRNKNNKDYSSLGASGAISSIMFCYIMVSPMSEIYLFFFPMKGWIAGALLLGVSYYLIRRKRTTDYSDNISHESHFWGALFGVAFILILKPVLMKNFIMQIAAAF